MTMRKFWVGLAFAAIIAEPAVAQDYQKNFVECAKEHGLRLDAQYAPRLRSDGRVVRKWYFQSEAQQAAFSDCVARKADLARTSSANGKPIRHGR
jgi:hypothetical protein